MNAELLQIDQKYFQQKREQVSAMLTGERFPAVLNELDKYDNRYNIPRRTIPFPSSSSSALYETIEESMAIFPAVREKLEEHFRYDREISDKKFKDFLNLYAIFASANIGNKLMAERFEKDSAPVQIKVRTDLTQNPDSLFQEYFKAFTQYVRDDILVSPNGDIKQTNDLAGVARLYFKEMRDLALEKKAKFAEYLHKVEGLSLEVNANSIIGFEIAGNGYNNLDVVVSWDEIIGNTEAKSMLKRAADRFFLYDPQSRENVFSQVATLPNTYHLHSRPGTGKTTMLQALRTYMMNLSLETKKQFHHVNITSMFESKWFGDSVKELDRLLLEGTNPNYVGLITIEDIDKMFVSLDDPTIHSADRKNLNHLLNALEGINTNRDRGNYMLVTTKNHQINEVLLGRIAQVIVHAPGPTTPEEYSGLLKLKLKKGIGNGYVKIATWDEIGKLSKEFDFSGRDIRNCVFSYLDQVTDVEIPNAIYKITDEDQKKDMLISLFLEKYKGKPAGAEPLISEIKRYQEEKLRQAKEEEAQRKQQLLRLGLEKRLIDEQVNAIMQGALDEK